MKRIVACCLFAAGATILLSGRAVSKEKNSAAARTASAAAQAATPVEAIQSLAGFKVERIYSVPADKEGSWVSLTADNKGRLLACDQYGSLYRITPPPVGSSGDAKVERLQAAIGGRKGCSTPSIAFMSS